ELPKGGYAPILRPLKSAPSKRASRPTLVSRNTVLVLTFADYSAAGDQKPFCGGLREELIHTLAGNNSGRLSAWEPSTDAPENDLREAAIRLNAAMIVTGGVRTEGSRARITANLIDTATGSFLWSASIDRQLENILAVQEEVAGLVAEQLSADS